MICNGQQTQISLQDTDVDCFAYCKEALHVPEQKVFGTSSSQLAFGREDGGSGLGWAWCLGIVS